jgi:hypothetical protein
MPRADRWCRGSACFGHGRTLEERREASPSDLRRDARIEAVKPAPRRSAPSTRSSQADLFDARILVAGAGEARRQGGGEAARPRQVVARSPAAPPPSAPPPRRLFAANRAPRSPWSSTSTPNGRPEGRAGGRLHQPIGARLRRHRSRPRCARAFDKPSARPMAASTFVVSNAGAAFQGKYRRARATRRCAGASSSTSSAHQTAAQNAVRVMRAAGAPAACLLFNTSKQAVNPGRRLRPLRPAQGGDSCSSRRQYALDHTAPIGVRANAVNADRIRTGLLRRRPARAARSKARGLTVQHYTCREGNLLEASEVTAAACRPGLPRTTRSPAAHHRFDVTTVDGGNIAATLR